MNDPKTPLPKRGAALLTAAILGLNSLPLHARVLRAPVRRAPATAVRGLPQMGLAGVALPGSPTSVLTPLTPDMDAVLPVLPTSALPLQQAAFQQRPDAALPRDSARSAADAAVAAGRVVPAAIGVQNADAAEVPASRTKERARTSAQVSGISKRVSAAMDSVGKVAEAAPADAKGLGGRLEAALMNRIAPKSVSDAVPLFTQRSFSGLAGAEENRPSARDAQERQKRAMVQELDRVASIFSGHYAPLDWKGEKFGTELRRLHEKAKRKIESSDFMTNTQFQDLLADFVASLKDYHVGIMFYSTEQAMLPLDISGADGRYFISHIDREALPEANFPYKVGDRIVEFDGEPIEELIAQIRREKGPNQRLTDTAIAQMKLTRRSRQGGDRVPSGLASLKILSKESGELSSVQLPWMRAEEQVPQDVPARDGGNLLEGFDPFAEPGQGSDLASQVREAVKKLLPNAVNPMAAVLGSIKGENDLSPHRIGARKSFVPDLGEKVWELPEQSPIHAAIYKTPDGKKVGFIRISDYMKPAQAADMFGQIIEKFEAETDHLVIDQVNNPGGSLFYMYGLLSRLTDKPLKVPKQRIVIGEEDAFQAAPLLQIAPMVQNDAMAQQVLGPSLGGYDVTLKVFKQFVAYAQFVMDQLGQGKRITDLGDMMGIDEIEPHATQRYTKPITLLINELDFSCGDFFAAILQDNGRARLFGTRTSGAGGAVKATQFPNQFGIAQLAYTWTIAMRDNGDPIENIGVHPDRDYRITAEDIENGYQGYLGELLKEIAHGQRLEARRIAEEGPADDAGESTETPPDAQS